MAMVDVDGSSLPANS